MAVRSGLSTSGPNQSESSWEDLAEVKSAGGTAALNICNRLLATGCPYVSGMEPSTVREILFSAGEARFRFHLQLHEMVHASGATAMADVSSLTMLLSSIGLCSSTDYDLVKGLLLGPRQLQLMETLLDLVESVIFGDQGSTHQKVQHSCFFLDTLCRQEDLDVVFPSSANLLAPDLSRTVDLKNKRPSLSQLCLEKADISQKLDGFRHLLQEETEGSSAKANPMALDSLCKTLSVSAITLAQTTGSFVCCYDNELRPWSHKESCVHPTLGAVMKRLRRHQNTFTQLLNSLELLRDSLANIQDLPSPVVKEKLTCLSKAYCRNRCEIHCCLAMLWPPHLETQGDRAETVFKECRALLAQLNIS